MAPSTSTATRAQKTTGLRYWMLRVLEECERASGSFEADPVHDLRVALRRCRSMADGIRALDPDLGWKSMKKAGKNLFQRLGDLRDTQIMMEWIEKLTPRTRPEPVSNEDHANGKYAAGAELNAEATDLAAHALLHILRGREKEQKLAAHTALEEFDRKQWRHWSKSLPLRAARFRPGSVLFRYLALERWTEARALHTRALRNRSQTALHSLRIGIKRFRYIVENFLPVEHKAWSNDLKEMQDLLGEVHDLDVLWNTAVACRVFPDADSRRRWRHRILAERSRRIDRYRAKMVGPDSLWNLWRAALPQGPQVQTLATRRMKLWAAGLDPDFPHSERVASLALQLYDGLLGTGWQPAINGSSARSSLLAAALLHDVGKSKGQKGHHKTSFDLIRGLGNPLGWKAADLQRAAIVARFHCGALPSRKHKSLRDLLPGEQKTAIQLAAVLRLANALDAPHDGRIRRIRIELPGKAQTGFQTNGRKRINGLPRHQRLGRNQPLIIAAEGYLPLAASARIIAAERHLLETVLRRPVVVKAMKHAATG